MAVTLPKILIKFQQLAASFVQRSERGIAILILRDDTAGGNGYATYTDATELTDAPCDLSCLFLGIDLTAL